MSAAGVAHRSGWTGAVLRWADRHDPTRFALHRAVRVAVIAPLALALAAVTGNAQVMVFAVFGSFAVLFFVDFPGSRSARLAAYCWLAIFGAGFIVIGTWASTTPWLAVTAMALLGLGILFAGVLSAAIAAGARAALLTVAVTVVILFNIVQPTGWQVGLVRIEDVALGCATGSIVGLLLWPRGAAAELRHSLADAYRQSGSLLVAVVSDITASRSTADVPATRAVAAAHRLDDALRGYLAERGARSLPLDTVSIAATSVNRIRLAAAATELDEWFTQVADVLQGRRTELGLICPHDTEPATLRAISRDHALLDGTDRAAYATALLATSIYLDDLARLQPTIATSLSAAHSGA